MKILCINCKPDLSYFTSRGLNLEVTHETTTEKFPLVDVGNKLSQNGEEVKIYTPDPCDFLNKKYPQYQYSIILVGWKPEDYDLRVKNTGGFSFKPPLKSGTNYGTIRVDQNETCYAVHEMHHILVAILLQKFGKFVCDAMDMTPTPEGLKPYFLNNEPNNPQSNHAITWNCIKPFLKELNSITYRKYKYFSEREVEKFKLKDDLWKILDKAREVAGIPFLISSGLRSIEQNRAVGGKDNSAHLRGLAVDLVCTSNFTRNSMLRGLYSVTEPIFIEIAKKHIHIDICSVIHSLSQTMLSDDE